MAASPRLKRAKTQPRNWSPTEWHASGGGSWSATGSTCGLKSLEPKIACPDFAAVPSELHIVQSSAGGVVSSNLSDDLHAGALVYHRLPRPGKLEIQATKPLGNQRDLALAYSPGVAAACMAIVAEPATAAELTSRANLVAVISNGTAVLGLGNIGPLAGKPVMEGKAVLFKRFADIDVFDIELATTDPQEIIRTCQLLEPTFGGINLEDIKAPECFLIEEELRRTMKIPVFHDDQHGTAIISGAALLNALELSGKPVASAKVVLNGAGAAAISCAEH